MFTCIGENDIYKRNLKFKSQHKLFCSPLIFWCLLRPWLYSDVTETKCLLGSKIIHVKDIKFHFSVYIFSWTFSNQLGWQTIYLSLTSGRLAAPQKFCLKVFVLFLLGVAVVVGGRCRGEGWWWIPRFCILISNHMHLLL